MSRPTRGQFFGALVTCAARLEYLARHQQIDPDEGFALRQARELITAELGQDLPLLDGPLVFDEDGCFSLWMTQEARAKEGAA